MKVTRGALLLLLPSMAPAWPVPVLPEVRLESTPFTLVGNALQSAPKVDFFVPPEPKNHITYMSHMPVLLVPRADCDVRFVRLPDASVDYKLTVVDPQVGDGR